MIDDLTACRLRLDADRFERGVPDEAPGAWDPDLLPPDLRERVEDATRDDVVAGQLRAAVAAREGPAGEAARRRARAVVDPALRRALSPISAEAARARAALGPPASGFAAAAVAAARSPDAGRARRAREAWRRWREERAEFDAAFRDEADGRARVWGVEGRRGLAAALRPLPAEPWADTLERGFVARLDESLPAALREVRDRPGAATPSGAGHRAALRLADLWWAGQGVVVADAPPPGGLPAARVAGPAGERALRLVPGEDERATRAALGAVGGWIRAGFLGDLGRMDEVCWADPAFEAAARRLCGRLALNPVFREESGLSPAPEARAEAELLEAVAPRVAWTYLRLVDLAAGPPDDGATAEAFRRAQGAPPDPLQDDALRRVEPGLPPDRAAELRGWCLAILLEEQLLRRFGRRWYAERAAHDRLRTVWDGEVGETAESMAIALDAGTIEPTPLLDACRPPRPGVR